MTQFHKNLFCLILFFSCSSFQVLQALTFLSNVAKAQPTAILASFFTFFTIAVPNFAMAAYQFHNSNVIDSEGKSSFVQSIFPFIMRLNEHGCTINPTEIHAKEYFLTGLVLSTISLVFLVTGGIFTKIEEKFGTTNSSIDNLMLGKNALE